MTSCTLNHKDSKTRHQGFTVLDSTLSQNGYGTAKFDPNFDWDISLEEIFLCLKNYSSSAPGPNGIPVEAYKKIPDLFSKSLLQAYNSFKHIRTNPKGFNHNLLFMLPKKYDKINEAGLPSYKPGSLRPLSISNFANRILSSCVNKKLVQWVGTNLNSCQTGYWPNRLISDNILTMNELFYRQASKNAVGFLLLVDFKAAFSSISQTFLFKAIQAWGVPQNMINVIKNLYKNCSHDLFINSRLGTGPTVKNGTKQGCPLSPTLFVMAIDILLHRLSLIPCLKTKHLKAYADDISLFFRDINKFTKISDTFDHFENASGLAVNIIKTVVIPCMRMTYQEWLVIYNSKWKDVKFSQEEKYLGTLVGTKVTMDSIFNPLYVKFAKRLQDWSRLHTSTPMRVKILNIYLNTVFSHMCSYYLIPPLVSS